ncbi:MAG: CoA-binding protein, partial [Chloroflexi bacterium]|nr:CoA-binding protein [Chloroflexota bacterium]
TSGKPIVVESVSGPGEENLRLLREAGVPVYPTPERAVDALATLWRYKQYRDSPEPPPGRTSALTAEQMSALQAVEASRQAGRTVLGPIEAETLLRAYGIPLAASRLARTAEEAVAAAAALGYPVALKIVSPQVLHKTEAGGVRLALGDASAVRQAFAEVVATAKAYAPDATIEGVLVQRQAGSNGHEVIVGMKRDEQFGPVVLVGLGGVFTEVLRDTALRVAPLTIADAQAMLQELRGYQLLAGARGQPPADLDALAGVLVRIADLALACPALAELDLNPVFVYPQGQGCLAVDARLMLRGP